MEGLLRQLSTFGPIMVRYKGTYWWTACEVKPVEHTEIKQLVKSTNQDLYEAVRELLKQSTITHKKLLDKLREPKQEKLQYGTSSDYKELF